jgi:hypothetical protein
MADFQHAINARIEEFVNDITELARQAAQETLQSALGGGGGARRASGGSKPVAAPRARRKSGKRSPEEIAATADQLLTFIKDNPGQRMEAIAKALGTTTKDLTLPVKKLVSKNLIRVEGQKRATSYYPAGGGSKSSRGTVRRRKRRGRRAS